MDLPAVRLPTQHAQAGLRNLRLPLDGELAFLGGDLITNITNERMARILII